MKMSKLDFLTVVIVGILLFALGFLIYQTMNLMNTDTEEQVEIAPPPNEVTDADLEAYDIENKDIDNNTADAETNQEGTEDEYPIDGADADDDTVEDAQDLAQEEEGPVDGTVDIDNAKAADKETTQISTKTGEYLIMGGSFRQRSNADNMVKRLHKLGFDDAAVYLFNRGAYAVAVVDRYDSWSKANATKKELQSQGIEVFMMKKR